MGVSGGSTARSVVWPEMLVIFCTEMLAYVSYKTGDSTQGQWNTPQAYVFYQFCV